MKVDVSKRVTELLTSVRDLMRGEAWTSGPKTTAFLVTLEERDALAIVKAMTLLDTCLPHEHKPTDWEMERAFEQAIARSQSAITLHLTV